MRREELYLRDIIEAADSIAQFLSDVDKQTLLENDLLQRAVLQKLTLIGEATNRLPANFKDRHREVNWADIVTFRNIAVHAYFDVDWSIVWVTATVDAPQFRSDVVRILSTEYSDKDIAD